VWQEWCIELLKGIGKLFIHPLFYLSIILVLAAGYKRVKRERRDFHVRVHSGYTELKSLFPLGIMAGILLSVISIVVGVTVPFAAIVIVGFLMLLISASGLYRFLSAAYTIGFSFFILLFGLTFKDQLNWIPSWFNQVGMEQLISLILLSSLLIIVEGIMMMKRGGQKTSPRIIKSPRGFNVGAHLSKKIMLIPIVVLFPAGPLVSTFEWWPVFHLGSFEFSFVCLPFLIGFRHLVKSTLPEVAMKQLGIQTIWIGILSLFISIGAYFYPILAIIAAATAIIGKEWIAYRHRIREEMSSSYYSRQPKGMMVLDTLPNSPADKMSLSIGEVIEKVNGIVVDNEDDFYRALERNRAYCKLEVIDTNGQIRFVQRELYEGEHYELGALLIGEKDREQWKATLH
jgi:hypothetical protein